jgi:hypothetical protein
MMEIQLPADSASVNHQYLLLFESRVALSKSKQGRNSLDRETVMAHMLAHWPVDRGFSGT